MDKHLLSSHKLVSDYSAKGKLKFLILVWSAFVAILIVTRLPVVQTALLRFSNAVTVDWVTSSVKFIINGLWFVAIPLGIGTIMTVLKKQNFDELRFYDTGIGFFNSKAGVERYADYAAIKLSYGSMQESFWIEAKTIALKSSAFGWREYTQSDILRNNLERYGKWS